MKFRRVAAAVGICVFLTAAVLAVEALVAIRAPRLAPGPPYELDRSATDGAPKVAWLGDSTAAGVGATGPEHALPSLVADAAPGPESLSVLATSGVEVQDIVSDQLPRLTRMAPDVVYISVGANDVTSLTGQRDFERHYTKLLEGIPAGARVVMLGVPDMGSPTRIPQPLRAIAGWRGRQLDGIVERLANQRGHIYVDIEGATGDQFRARPETYFASDHFHPSDAGYRLWADAVLDAVNR